MTRADAQAPTPQSPLRSYAVWIGLACALAASGVWLADGLLSTRAGGDSPFLLVRVNQLGQSLGDGVIPARWMPDAAFGLGYPFFNFYAALPFYLAAVLGMLGLPTITAIKVTQTLGALGAAFGMFGLARKLYSGRHAARSAALAAVAYTVAPFHLANVYVRGDSLSEFWAFVWFPLILSAVVNAPSTAHRPLNTDDRPASSAHRVLVIALPLAALVLTHNVSMLLFAPFVAAWALATLWAQRAAPAAALRHALLLLSAAALAMALSAWFWLPALGEAGAAQLGEQTTGYFNYANHFRLGGLCTPSLFVSTCADRPIDQINLVQATLFADSAPPQAFGMGLVQALAVLLGAAFWLRHPGPVRWLVPILFGAATLLMTPLAAPIWSALPPLQLAQFPWRLLSVQAVFASLLIGAIGLIDGRRAGLAPLVAGLALCAAVVPMVTQISALRIRQDDISPRTMQLYEWYSGIIGTTIRAEYLPASAQPVPATGPDVLGQSRRALIAQDGVPADALSSEIESLEVDAQVWRIQVNAESLTVALPLIYTPAWQAIDANSGASLSIAPYPGSGWTQLTLPRGTHRIMLRLTGTPLQQAGERVSAVALALAAIALVLALRRSTRAAWRRAGLLTLAVLLALAVPVFAERLIQRRALAAQEGEFVDFARQPFVHRGGMTLSNGAAQATLIGATVEPRRLVAGEAFTLTLRWRDGAVPLELVQELPSASERFDIFKHGREQTRITEAVSVHTVPSSTLPGPVLLMLLPADGWSSATSEAWVAGKTVAGVTLIGPTVTETAPNAPAASVATFANGIRAHEIDWLRPDGERVCFRARWSRRGAVNQADALQVSFKLFAADGRLVAQADGQPVQGLAPTWSWRDDVVVADSRCVRVVDPRQPLQQDERYRLEITWYRLLTGAVTGQATLTGAADMRDGALNIPK